MSHCSKLFPKRIGGVYDKMCNKDLLRQSILSAARNKDGIGSVRTVIKNLDEYVDILYDMLINETYEPAPLTEMIVQSRDKTRIIKKAIFFPDRCIQHAIAKVMLPKWNEIITDKTFASWKGRGINNRNKKYDIVYNLKHYINEYPLYLPLYCLKIDIKKCYPSVDLDILDKILAKHCKDERMLKLIHKITHVDTGLIIGSYISQLLINLYLTPLDLYIIHELNISHYMRYMDDIIILSHDKKFLHECMHRIMNFLWYELHIELNNKRQIFPVGNNKHERSIDFCGYKFYRQYTQLRNWIKENIKDKCDNPKSMAAYKGMLQNCESANFYNTLNKTKTNDKIMNFGDLKFNKISRKFEGKKVHLDNLVGKSLTILDFEICDSKKKAGTQYVQIQYRDEDNGKLYFVTTASECILNIMMQISHDDLPIENAVICKNHGFYYKGTVENTEQYEVDEPAQIYQMNSTPGYTNPIQYPNNISYSSQQYPQQMPYNQGLSAQQIPFMQQYPQTIQFPQNQQPTAQPLL